MKRPLPEFLLCALLVVLLVRATYAGVTVSGLDAVPDVAGFIKKTVIEKYDRRDDGVIRASSVKNDLEKALHSKGYYDARVIQQSRGALTFSISPGAAYTINKIKISGYDPAKDISLREGDVLDADAVIRTQKKLFEHVARSSCFYNLSVRHEVKLNKTNNSADIHFIVDGTPDVKFGAVSFSGAGHIKDEYLQNFLKFKEGDCWSYNKIEETKAALLETGLLSSVVLDLPETSSAGGVVPTAFVLKERNMRRVRLGAQFSTSEGPGVLAEWQHNNYFNAGEQLTLSTQVSTLLQSLGADLIKPFFLSEVQTLQISTALEREDTDAFEEVSLNASAIIDRKLSKRWSGGLGVGFEASRVTDDQQDKTTFGLVSFPARLNYDSRDNILNARTGYTLSLRSEPYFDVLGETDPFYKNRFTATAYYGLGRDENAPILAFRGSIGSIVGSAIEDIPRSKRFYAGGGGSIRGFGFQEAGPLDADNDPTGGRSLAEGSVELRHKFNDRFGAVAFTDAGGVYDTSLPDFDGALFVGAGIGARYYTDFGPLRFDVATPVSGKRSSDQAFQIYISIGQAF